MQGGDKDAKEREKNKQKDAGKQAIVRRYRWELEQLVHTRAFHAAMIIFTAWFSDILSTIYQSFDTLLRLPLSRMEQDCHWHCVHRQLT